jgi:hypothetical protein
MGNRMVREFEEYRPYISIRQFRQEIGKYVSQEQVAEYEKYVYVPIAINDADAATLQQIPGVDAAEAEELLAGRPYASVDAFLTRLAGYVSEADLTPIGWRMGRLRVQRRGGCGPPAGGLYGARHSARQRRGHPTGRRTHPVAAMIRPTEDKVSTACPMPV